MSPLATTKHDKSLDIPPKHEAMYIVLILIVVMAASIPLLFRTELPDQLIQQFPLAVPRRPPLPIDSNIAKGKIAFDVPPEMKEGETKQVEVRIAKGVSEAVTSALRQTLSKNTQVDNLQVAPFMTVRLTSEKDVFDITPLTDEKQLVWGDSYTSWSWLVEPQKAGKQVLYLSVGTRFKLPGRDDEETQFNPLYQRNIDVTVDRMYETKRLVSGNWQWLIATLAIPLVGFLWHLRKPKEPKYTPQDPL
jgi:hypothetical protein